MVNSTVPDFFQEETTDAQRAQVDWLVREIGLDSAFFENLVGADEATFSAWCASDTLLPAGGEETLRELWRLMLHLLSFQGFDCSRVRDLFHQTMPADQSGFRSPRTPPWGGMSLKAYLERTRTVGIEKVAYWVTGLRFGYPFVD